MVDKVNIPDKEVPKLDFNSSLLTLNSIMHNKKYRIFLLGILVNY